MCNRDVRWIVMSLTGLLSLIDPHRIMLSTLLFLLALFFEVSSDLTLNVASTGVSSTPCGHSQEQPCISISVALKSDKSVTEISIPRDGIADTQITVQCLLFSLARSLFRCFFDSQ